MADPNTPTPRTDALKLELVQAAHNRIANYPKDGWLENVCHIADKTLNELASVERELADLRGQLPDGMQDCTIVFKECEKGHGWLTATNWVQHPCPTCTLETERKAREEAEQAYVERIRRLWKMLDAERTAADAAERRVKKIEAALGYCETDYNYLLTITADRDHLHDWLRGRVVAIRALKESAGGQAWPSGKGDWNKPFEQHSAVPDDGICGVDVDHGTCILPAGHSGEHRSPIPADEVATPDRTGEAD